MDFFKILPFAVFAMILLINNVVMPAVIGPFLFWLLNPRLERWDLIWTDIMKEEDRSRSRLPLLGGALMWVGAVGGLVTCFLISTNIYHVSIGGGLQAGPGSGSEAIFSAGLDIACRDDHRCNPVERGMTATISFEKFCFRYRKSALWALSDIDLSVEKGEFLGIVGPSGAGKSTLAAAIGAFIPHLVRGQTKGGLLVDGTDTGNCSPRDLAGIVGTVFQDFESQIFSSRADIEVAFGPENLGLPRSEIVSRVKRSLAYVSLTEKATRVPASLSGGEKQRLVVASILSMDPQHPCLRRAGDATWTPRASGRCFCSSSVSFVNGTGPRSSSTTKRTT